MSETGDNMWTKLADARTRIAKLEAENTELRGWYEAESRAVAALATDKYKVEAENARLGYANSNLKGALNTALPYLTSKQRVEVGEHLRGDE